MIAVAMFQKFSEEKKLRKSQKRDWILHIFLSIEKHMTAEDLWTAVRKKHPSVGFATVYRTLKLLCESGLCRELRFEDGTSRYEHLYGHDHHDHLICTQCGKFVEVFEPQIENLQEALMKRNNFLPQRHRMDLYGICNECNNK